MCEKEIMMLKCELKAMKTKYEKELSDCVKSFKERDSYKEQLAAMGEMNQELENELKLTRNQNSELRNIIEGLHDEIFELKRINNDKLSSDEEELLRKQKECLSQISSVEISTQNGEVLSSYEIENGEIKILNEIINEDDDDDVLVPRVGRRGRPSKLTEEQKKQNIHKSQIEYHRKRYKDDTEYREKLKQKGREKYRKLKSNKPLKELTVEEHKLLKKAYNNRYREKRKLLQEKVEK